MTITLLYSCQGCGLVKAAVEVPARGQETVIEWLDSSAYLIAQDHQRRSFGCPSQTCDLMIPITGSTKVGGPPVQ